MNITLVAPYFSGSHKSWATELKANSRHQIKILSLPGRHWKWRMHGAAISLAKQYLALEQSTDLIITTDMLDVATFSALTKKSTANIPIVTYFHENQLSYPWSPTDKDVRKGRDFHYGFINWTSILASDKVLFNSNYNLTSFYKELEILLKAMPDNRDVDLIEIAKSNSEKLALGVQLEDIYTPIINKNFNKPVILWNHRWEFDKNPQDFFHSLLHLKKNEIDFELIICGEGFEKKPEIFAKIKSDFEQEIVHFGYVETREEYIELLQRANILPVTSQQEFFGQSIMEAMAAGCLPLLPNRLVYPEHIPISLQSALLYNDLSELKTSLLAICSELDTILPIIESTQSIAMLYDWKQIIELYDNTFESIGNQ